MKEYIKDLTPEIIISRLKQGEVLTNGKRTVELIDGLLVAKRDDDWAIGCAIAKSFDDELYFERPAPELKLEIGKFYSTRDGKKAYVFAVNSAGKYNVAIEGEGAYSVFAGGYYSEEEETDGDLIGLWEEKPKTTDLYQEILKLAKQHFCASEIQKKLGCDLSTIYYHRRRHPELIQYLKDGRSKC